MSNGFAGSARLDERRRRRLATDGDTATTGVQPPRKLAAPANAGNTRRLLHTGPESETLSCQPFPLSQVVPAAGWKHLVRCVILMGFGAGVLLSAYAHEVLANSLTPMMIRGLRLFGVEAFRWYGSLLLLLTAQICWLIGWARSHSINDFNGRYRTWNKAATAWLLFSICLAVGASHPWVNFASSLLPGNTWQREFLVRCVPCALAGSWVLLLMLSDMRGCRASCSMLLLAACCYLATGMLLLDLPLFNGLPLRDFWGDLLLLSGHLISVLAVSWHARYVIHTSVDPIGKRRKQNLVRRPHSWFSFLSRAPRVAPADISENSSTDSNSDAESRPLKKSRIRTKTRESASGISSEVKKLRFRVDGTATAAETVEAEPTDSGAHSSSILNDRAQSNSGRTTATPQPAVRTAAPSTVVSAAANAVVESRPAVRTAETPAAQQPVPVVADRKLIEPLRPATAATAVVAAPATVVQRSEPSDVDSAFDDDESGDADQYAGLSRKERKRLRREQRSRP